jgi:DNA-binding CsgD family transcriptional regulator
MPDRLETDLLDEHQWIYVRSQYHLTPRELQIAKLACRGMSNKQMAQTLNINSGTVKTHIRNIYRRVHVRGKVAMLLRFIAVAQRHAGKAAPIAAVPVIEVKRSKRRKEIRHASSGRSQDCEDESGCQNPSFSPANLSEHRQANLRALLREIDRLI